MSNQPKLAHKIVLEGKITLLTGLHIGGNSTGMEIGGVNATVLRNPITGQPYIPGSSLKGKIRSLLEQQAGNFSRLSNIINNGPSNDSQVDTVQMFGMVKGTNENIVSRVIFRDCKMHKADLLAKKVKTFDLPFTEVKTEVVIDRITSSAQPRSLERVPAGVEFCLSVVLNIWENSEKDINEHDMLEILFNGFNLLEKDYLGGKGSRGSGQVKIGIEKITKDSDGDLNPLIPPSLNYSDEYAAPIYRV
jgi:CRISPR-associated protein Csm3